MRQHFAADWAFGIRGAIENVVRREFKSMLRIWPIVQSFNFEAYEVNSDYFVLLLRDKLSGIPTGPGTLQSFPCSDYPVLPLTKENSSLWFAYLISKFNIKEEDAAMILPIHDCGENSALKDYGLFTKVEKEIWNFQLNINISRQYVHIKQGNTSKPDAPIQNTYNIYGTNSRVNINSADSSVNVTNEVSPEIFGQIIEVIKKSTASINVTNKMVSAVEKMQQEYGKTTFRQSYRNFMATLADHVQILSLVAPYLPGLANLII